MVRTKGPSSKLIAEQALKLLSVQHKHASKVAALCRVLKCTMKELMDVEAQIKTESESIAGENYRAHHLVGFEERGSNEEQIENHGLITAPDFQSVYHMSMMTIMTADLVASESVPPPLPDEETVV
jgi:DNA-binding Xre family transcriptional regulator